MPASAHGQIESARDGRPADGADIAEDHIHDDLATAANSEHSRTGEHRRDANEGPTGDTSKPAKQRPGASLRTARNSTHRCISHAATRLPGFDIAPATGSGAGGGR